MELSQLMTEKRNQNSMGLDAASTMEMLQIINNEDKKIAFAVEKVLPQIEIAIENIYKRLSDGGRLFYAGAGTSGRVGVIDAAECPPTFMTSPQMVQTIMAGGADAFFHAVEGSEDNREQGKVDLKARNFGNQDVLVGMTASGRTPYPIGALKYAKELGAYTISLTCNSYSEISQYADCRIEVIAGPEVLTGSTRMKAATSHKMVLNMISTVTMTKLGKVYENLMVDVDCSNYKLKERAKRMIMEIANVSYEEAECILKQTDYKVKPAIVMLKAGVTYEEAKQAIKRENGHIRKAIRFIS